MAIKVAAKPSPSKGKGAKAASSKSKPASTRKKAASDTSDTLARGKAKQQSGSSDARPKGGAAPALTEQDVPRVIEHLRASGGIKTVAAQRLNISRRTLYRFLDAHPEIEEELTEIVNEIGDVVEAQIIKAINAGDMQTVRWYAELKLKDRGYVRRVENVGKNGGPMEVVEKTDLSEYTDEEVAIMAAAARRRKESQASNQG